MTDNPELSAREHILKHVAEQRELDAAATQGPWNADWAYIIAPVPNGRPGGENIGMMVERPRYELVPFEANAELIASMRNNHAAHLSGLEVLVLKRCEVCDDTGRYQGDWDGVKSVSVHCNCGRKVALESIARSLGWKG